MFETDSAVLHKPRWPMLMLMSGLSLLGWFAYEEAVWQSYALTRWGRFELNLDGLKSLALTVIAYFITIGLFFRCTNHAGAMNRTRMRLLRLLLLGVSAFFELLGVGAFLVISSELISGDWTPALVSLALASLAWIFLLMLLAGALIRIGRRQP